MTTWKPVAGYEGYYEVSDEGDVRSVDRVLPPDTLGRVARRKGKMLSKVGSDDGYVRVVLSKNGIHEFRFVHRLVLETFVGPCPKGMEGCHNDSDPANNFKENLRWDTPQSNQADRRANGTSVVGSGNGRAKLTEEQAADIRKRAAEGTRQIELAKEYGVSKHIVWAVCHGKTWNHI